MNVYTTVINRSIGLVVKLNGLKRVRPSTSFVNFFKFLILHLSSHFGAEHHLNRRNLITLAWWREGGMERVHKFIRNSSLPEERHQEHHQSISSLQEQPFLYAGTLHKLLPTRMQLKIFSP
jgi:hypothetical protein